jgi:hypothetical protein
VEVLRERGALHRQRHLRGECLERVDLLAREGNIGREQEEPERRIADEERQEEGEPPLQAQLGPHDLGKRPERHLLGDGRDLTQPAVRFPRQLPFAPVRRRRDDRTLVLADEHVNGCGLLDERLDRRHGGGADLVAAGRGDEIDAGASKCELARCGPFLLADEARHPADHEEEQRRRRCDQDENVGVSPRLPRSDSGGDQAGAREQGEPQRGESRPRVDGGLLECPHRRMERRRPPEEVVQDPADVVDQLVVVRVREQRVRVRRIDGEQADDAREEEVERRRALAGVDREPDRGGEEQEVPERVGGGNGLLERRQAGEMDVRRDEEHPGDERDPERQDQRVDHGGLVALRVAAPHEHEQPGDQRRVDGQVDGVAEGRELDVDAEQLRVAVGVDVAGEEQELPDDEEDPGQPRPRSVEHDPGCDRDRRRESEQVDDRAAPDQRRQPEVAGCEQAADPEVGDPDA